MSFKIEFSRAMGRVLYGSNILNVTEVWGRKDTERFRASMGCDVVTPNPSQYGKESFSFYFNRVESFFLVR